MGQAEQGIAIVTGNVDGGESDDLLDENIKTQRKHSCHGTNARQSPRSGSKKFQGPDGSTAGFFEKIEVS
jgi:hypothetical protein